MKESKASWLDWLLYFGSKDERHRAGADRAGHLAFWFVFTATVVDFVLKLPRFKAEEDHVAAFGLVGLDFVIVLGGGVLYAWQWIRSGVTFSDTPTQRRLLAWMGPLAGLGAAIAITAPWSFPAEVWPAKLLGGAVAGAIAWPVTILLYRLQDGAARRRAEKAEQQTPE